MGIFNAIKFLIEMNNHTAQHNCQLLQMNNHTHQHNSLPLQALFVNDCV